MVVCECVEEICCCWLFRCRPRFRDYTAISREEVFDYYAPPSSLRWAITLIQLQQDDYNDKKFWLGFCRDRLLSYYSRPQLQLFCMEDSRFLFWKNVMQLCTDVSFWKVGLGRSRPPLALVRGRRRSAADSIKSLWRKDFFSIRRVLCT
jgi:hypothetical protein